MKYWLISLFCLVVGSAIWFGISLQTILWIQFGDTGLLQSEKNMIITQFHANDIMQVILTLGLLSYGIFRFRTVLLFMLKRQNSASNEPNPTEVKHDR